MGEAFQIRDQSAACFLTFQVVGWADVFSRQQYRDILLESFSYCRQEKGLLLYAYVIMSNHVHVIIQSQVDDLSGLVRDLKRHTSKKILTSISENSKESRREWLLMIFRYHARFNKRTDKLQFWTHENHVVELCTSEMIDSRIKYIHENPVRAGIVENAEDYLYSSARS